MRHIRALDLADIDVVAGHAGRPIDVGPLVGAWLNYDTDSVGPRRLTISRRDGRLVLDSPEWSEVDGAAFAADAGAHEAVGFLARADRLLLAGYLNKRLLVVDCYTRGSAHHFRRDHFYPL